MVLGSQPLGAGVVTNPDQVAQRLVLERVKERINVSQVCQEALLVAVEAHERSLADRRAEIVQRLHAAQDEFSYAFHRGTAAGREWAAEHATWPELVTVAQWGVIAHPDQLTRKRPMPKVGIQGGHGDRAPSATPARASLCPSERDRRAPYLQRRSRRAVLGGLSRRCEGGLQTGQLRLQAR